MSSRVTDDSSERAARTMAPRFIDEHGSAANSCDATLICSPGSGENMNKLHDKLRRMFLDEIQAILLVGKLSTELF